MNTPNRLVESNPNEALEQPTASRCDWYCLHNAFVILAFMFVFWALSLWNEIVGEIKVGKDKELVSFMLTFVYVISTIAAVLLVLSSCIAWCCLDYSPRRKRELAGLLLLLFSLIMCVRIYFKDP